MYNYNKEYFKKYYKKNAKKIKKAQRGYYLKDKEKYKKQALKSIKKRKKSNPEEFRKRAGERLLKYSKTPKGIYTKILVPRCKKSNKALKITRFEFIKWYNAVEKKCVFCDIPISLIKLVPSKGGQKRLSIDRIDNKKGYEKGNLQLCCLTCNRIKSDIFNEKDMKKLANLFIKPLWKKKIQKN